MRRGDASKRIAELKTAEGGDIICFGSLTTWNDLLARGLVDELHVLVGPGAIGSGVPTFSNRIDQKLTLLDAQPQEDSGLVALRYAVGDGVGALQ